MLQVYTIFTKLGNNDFYLAKNGKGGQQIVMNGSNHCEKFPEKSFKFANTVRKIFAEISTDLHLTTLGFLIKIFRKRKFGHCTFSKSIFLNLFVIGR